MTNFETMDKMDINFVEISDQELMEVEGGEFFTATILGVAAWKLGLGVLGAFGAGAGLAYYANRP